MGEGRYFGFVLSTGVVPWVFAYVLPSWGGSCTLWAVLVLQVPPSLPREGPESCLSRFPSDGIQDLWVYQLLLYSVPSQGLAQVSRPYSQYCEHSGLC